MLALHDSRLLEAFGWDVAFWIVSDEKPAHACVAALGRRRDSGEDEMWDVHPLESDGRNVASRKTEDAESLARAGAWIYVFGSQFGSKKGPLEPPRHWLARFNESLVDLNGDSISATITVAKRPFLLHRLINDAIESSPVLLIGRGSHEAEDLVLATSRRGERKDKSWRDLIRDHDRPINVEAATFAPNGRLLIGLRYPVTMDGHPLVVEIDGVDRYFEDGGTPAITAIWQLEDIGSRDEPRGIRELECRGTEVHLIAGDLDSSPEQSVLLHDHPSGELALSEHHFFTLPLAPAHTLRSQLVRGFEKRSDIECVVLADDGSIWYAADDEEIRLFSVKQDVQ